MKKTVFWTLASNFHYSHRKYCGSEPPLINIRTHPIHEEIPFLPGTGNNKNRPIRDKNIYFYFLAELGLAQTSTYWRYIRLLMRCKTNPSSHRQSQYGRYPTASCPLEVVPCTSMTNRPRPLPPHAVRIECKPLSEGCRSQS